MAEHITVAQQQTHYDEAADSQSDEDLHVFSYGHIGDIFSGCSSTKPVKNNISLIIWQFETKSVLMGLFGKVSFTKAVLCDTKSVQGVLLRAAPPLYFRTHDLIFFLVYSTR